MDKEEIIKEMEMDYDQLVQYLLNKYGGSKYDYFVNEGCKTKNKKVTRSNEGLLCHHIDEDKGYCLCSPVAAQCFSFGYQKKERLVYCNYIEHLLLHILIGKNSYWKRRSTLESTTAFNLFITPGMGYICSDINGLFEKNGSSLKWKQRCYQEIKDNFDDYIFILNSFIEYLFNNYTGKKEYMKLDRDKSTFKSHRDFDSEIDRMKRTLSSISHTELNQTVYERLLDF